MEGACLAEGRSILSYLDRGAVDDDCGGSDSVRLDDSYSRILCMIDVS